MCVCVWVTFVGRSWGGTRLVTSDLCTSTEPRTLRRKFENIGQGLESSRTGEATSGCNRGVAVKVDAIGELQLKWMQTRSSSWIGRNRGGAAKVDTIGELLKSGTESSCSVWADTSCEQQQPGSSSWSGHNRGGQQLCTESCLVPE